MALVYVWHTHSAPAAADGPGVSAAGTKRATAAADGTTSTVSPAVAASKRVANDNNVRSPLRYLAVKWGHGADLDIDMLLQLHWLVCYAPFYAFIHTQWAPNSSEHLIPLQVSVRICPVTILEVRQS